MFEYGIVSLIISPTVFFLTLLKIAVSGGLHGHFTIFLIILRFIVMNIINCLKIYTRYIMILEGKGLYEAILKSCDLSFHHLKESFKYVRIQTILIINFSFNLFIILLIPIILVYLAIVSNNIQYLGVKRTIYGIFFLSIIFGSYASSMIRAFFAYFWQEIYDTLNRQKNK